MDGRASSRPMWAGSTGRTAGRRSWTSRIQELGDGWEVGDAFGTRKQRSLSEPYIGAFAGDAGRLQRDADGGRTNRIDLPAASTTEVMQRSSTAHPGSMPKDADPAGLSTLGALSAPGFTDK